jgi:hypothetical protein
MAYNFANASKSRELLSMTESSMSHEERTEVDRLDSPSFISCASIGEDSQSSRDAEGVADPLFPMWIRTQSYFASSTLSECSNSTEGDNQQAPSGGAVDPMQAPTLKLTPCAQKSGSPCSSLSDKATKLAPGLPTGKVGSARSDQRTTVMMRNLPTTFSRARLIDLLNSKGFSGQFDLIYLPIDFGSACNLGYAFVNMTTHQQALHLWEVFHGFAAWPALGCRKVCAVCWGAVQGLRANVARYQNCPIMCKHVVPDDYKPALFRCGMQIPFPLKTSRSKAMFHCSARTGIQMPGLCSFMQREQ